MTEFEFLAECVQRLNRLGLSYMLTGSTASSYWGIPRTTHDLDIVIELPWSSAHALYEAFCHDFDIDERAIQAAVINPLFFNAVEKRSQMKADFWVLRSSAFDQMSFSRRMRIQVFGAPTWVPTAEDTILQKLRWNQITPSERQLTDAAGVFAVRENSLDIAYMRQWAQVLGVSATLEDIISGRIKPKLT